MKGETGHIFVVHTLKERMPPFLLRNNAVGIIDTDLAAGVNAVLPFPEFDQPGPPAIVEINGQTVNNHMERQGGRIIERAVTEVSLHGTCPRSKDILCGYIAKAEGL